MKGDPVAPPPGVVYGRYLYQLIAPEGDRQPGWWEPLGGPGIMNTPAGHDAVIARHNRQDRWRFRWRFRWRWQEVLPGDIDYPKERGDDQ